MFRMQCVFDTWGVCEVMCKAHWRPGCTWEAWESRANFSSQMIKRTLASAFRIQISSQCGSLLFLVDQKLAPTPDSWVGSADEAEPYVGSQWPPWSHWWLKTCFWLHLIMPRPWPTASSADAPWTKRALPHPFSSRREPSWTTSEGNPEVWWGWKVAQSIVGVNTESAVPRFRVGPPHQGEP